MGWSNVLDHPFLSITITQDLTNSYTMVGTGDDNLWPPSTPQPLTGGVYNGYQKVTNFQVNDSIRMTLENNEDVIINEQGRYDFMGSLSMRHSANNSVSAFVFAIEVDGFYIFNGRPVKAKLPNGDDPANLSGGGVLKAQKGWKVSLWCASDKSGTLMVDTSEITIKRFTTSI